MTRRWMIVILAVCVVATVAAIVYAAGKATSEVPEVIRAQGFEVVDEKGVFRARLGVTDIAGGGVALTLCDQNGKLRAGMAVSDVGPVSLSFTDEQESPRIQMIVDTGFALVQLLSGKTVPLLEALPGGKGTEEEVKKAAKEAFKEVKVRAILLMDYESDTPTIMLFDEKGQPIWEPQ